MSKSRLCVVLPIAPSLLRRRHEVFPRGTGQSQQHGFPAFRLWIEHGEDGVGNWEQRMGPGRGSLGQDRGGDK